MTNNADLDQLASEEANWSGSTLFANAGYIQAQQNELKSPTPLFLGEMKQRFIHFGWKMPYPELWISQHG